MYKTVIFDLDGTLLDTLRDLTVAGNHTLQAMGLPTHAVADYRRMVGNGVAVLIERMLPQSHRSAADIEKASALFSAYYTAHMNDYTRPYPGMVALLQALRAQGVCVAVLSNKDDVFVQPIVEQYFAGLVDVAMGLCEGFLPKPNPAALHFILQKLQATPESTLYCGDSDVDMMTAKNAGLPGCGVLWGFREKEELQRAGATMLAKDTADLQQIILGE